MARPPPCIADRARRGLLPFREEQDVSPDHVVDLLLEREVVQTSTNHENEEGGTALMGAAYHGRASVVRRLLRADADAGMRVWQVDTAPETCLKGTSRPRWVTLHLARRQRMPLTPAEN